MNTEPKIILTTDRLILRTWQVTDIPAMAAISADPQVMEFFPAIQDKEATIKLTNHNNDHYEKYGYAFYALEIKATGEFIGFVGLNHPPYEIPNFKPKGSPVVEIGWRLAARHWNQGYATEAARAVLEHAFTQLKLDEIISFTAAINTKSRHIMEKIGLQHDKTDDFDHPKIAENDRLKKHVLYRLTRDKYLINQS